MTKHEERQVVPADQKGIPKDWKRTKLTKIPVGWIVEGTSTVQCLCPYCRYGEGYNKPVIYGVARPGYRTCSKCGTKFLALVNDPTKFSWLWRILAKRGWL